MQRVFLFIILMVFAAGAFGQAPAAGFDLSNYGVKIEPDKRLVVVLATLEMATEKNAEGKDERLLDTQLSDSGKKFRDQLIKDNAGLNEDVRRRISNFVTQYKKRHLSATDAEIIAPFISMAYTLTPVPDLGDPVITSDLPGSLLDVLDFAPLAREFYRRSTIGSKLDDYVKEYRLESDGILRSSAREMVSELLDYLHTRPRLFFKEKIKVETSKSASKSGTLEKTEIREHERRFIIVPEKLAAKGNINFLNVRDDYYVIVPPDSDLIFSETRRAFLQFVVDPLVLGNSREIAAMRDWVKPLLDERRKTDPAVSPDVFLAVSRSLVAAIDIRQTEYIQTRIATTRSRQNIELAKTDDEKRAVSTELENFKRSMADESTLQLYEDYEKGAVLSLYFAEQLKGIEASGFDIASSLREMIASFDAAKETERIAASSDARKRALAAREDRRRNPGNRTGIAENPVTTRLLEIQKTIDAKDYPKAAADLKHLLVKNPSEPRIHYNIGRVAALVATATEDAEMQAQKLLEAKEAYSNVLTTATTATDRSLLSLTYFALGRIYEHFNDEETAVKLYDLAIKLTDIAGGAYREAIAAKQKLLKPQ